MSPIFVLLLAATPRQVVWVDISQAILGTTDGQKVKSQLDDEHRRINREIRAKEERLIHERASIPPERYDDEAQRIQEEVGKQQDALDKKQDQLLAPIIARMKRLIETHNAKGIDPLVLDLSEQPLVDPPKQCDLTSWVVRSYAATQVPEPKPINPCRFSGFAYVDFDRALAQSSAGKAATASLDAFKEKGQKELDQRQRQLAEIERASKERPQGKEQFELERREVAMLFAKYQRELRDKEQATEKELYERLEKGLAEIVKQLPTVLFIEKIEDQKQTLEPSCDATDWAAKLIDAKAGLEALRQTCPVAK